MVEQKQQWKTNKFSIRLCSLNLGIILTLTLCGCQGDLSLSSDSLPSNNSQSTNIETSSSEIKTLSEAIVAPPSTLDYDQVPISDLGLYDGSYSSFVIQNDLVYLTRYAQSDPNSTESAYCHTIDVFSLTGQTIVNSYSLPWTTNGKFVQGAPDGVLILDRTNAQTDRQIPIVLLWPATGEITPVEIDYEYPYASGPKPFISIDQDKIYFSYRAVIYCYCLSDRTLTTEDLEQLGYSDFLLFLKCSTTWVYDKMAFLYQRRERLKNFVKAAGFNSVIILESALIQAALFVAVESTRHILRKLERKIKFHLAMERY